MRRRKQAHMYLRAAVAMAASFASRQHMITMSNYLEGQMMCQRRPLATELAHRARHTTPLAAD